MCSSRRDSMEKTMTSSSYGNDPPTGSATLFSAARLENLIESDCTSTMTSSLISLNYDARRDDVASCVVDGLEDTPFASLRRRRHLRSTSSYYADWLTSLELRSRQSAADKDNGGSVRPQSFTISAILGLADEPQRKRGDEAPWSAGLGKLDRWILTKEMLQRSDSAEDQLGRKRSPYSNGGRFKECNDEKTTSSSDIGRTSPAAESETKQRKRIRTIYTQEQLERLEEEFDRQQYLIGTERYFLASRLGLAEAQVKVWFQNRRIKWRRQAVEAQRHSRLQPYSDHYHFQRHRSQSFMSHTFDVTSRLPATDVSIERIGSDAINTSSSSSTASMIRCRSASSTGFAAAAAAAAVGRDAVGSNRCQSAVRENEAVRSANSVEILSCYRVVPSSEMNRCLTGNDLVVDLRMQV